MAQGSNRRPALDQTHNPPSSVEIAVKVPVLATLTAKDGTASSQTVSPLFENRIEQEAPAPLPWLRHSTTALGLSGPSMDKENDNRGCTSAFGNLIASISPDAERKWPSFVGWSGIEVMSER
jgi:hypothetical protein